MFKKLIGALALTTAMVGATQASDIATIVSSTYGLYNDNGHRICSGQFYKSDDKEDLFLTAAHCVKTIRDRYSVHKITRDSKLNTIYEEVIYMVPIRILTSEDVAVLRVIDPTVADFTTVDVAIPGEFEEIVGTSLLGVGIPEVPVKPLDLMITDGLFSGVVKNVFGLDTLSYRTTVAIDSGSSGGGLYADFNGSWKLIGVASAASDAFPYATVWATSPNVNKVIGYVEASPKDLDGDPTTESAREALLNK